MVRSNRQSRLVGFSKAIIPMNSELGRTVNGFSITFSGILATEMVSCEGFFGWYMKIDWNIISQVVFGKYFPLPTFSELLERTSIVLSTKWLTACDKNKIYWTLLLVMIRTKALYTPIYAHYTHPYTHTVYINTSYVYSSHLGSHILRQLLPLWYGYLKFHIVFCQ